MALHGGATANAQFFCCRRKIGKTIQKFESRQIVSEDNCGPCEGNFKGL